MRKLIVLLVLMICAPAWPARYALLIGNADGGPGRQTLRYPGNDVTGLRDILAGVCGFPAGNISMLVNQSPEQVRRAFAEMRARLAPLSEESVVLVYYTGHADDDALMMGEDRFMLADFKKCLDDLPARIRIAVLDACQSGSVTRIKGGALAEPFLFREDSRIKGDVVLYSSSASENAQESDIYRNSIFTFHFINALRGCGDATNDRKVTLNEAYTYSYARTVASTAQTSGGVQHPGYQFKIIGEGDIVLADLTVRTQGIVLADDVAGAVTILDDHGILTADFTKESASRLFIALSPGRYQAIGRMNGVQKQARVNIDTAATVLIAADDFAAIPVARGRAKGAENSTSVADAAGGIARTAPVETPVIKQAIMPEINEQEEPARRESAFSIGIAIAGSVDYTDFTDLTQSLEQHYAGYSMFGMLPLFPLRHFNAMPSIMVELEVRSGMVLSWGYGSYRDKAQSSYSGISASPFDNSAYPVVLSTTTTVSDAHYFTSAGYRVKSGIARNVSIHAGLMVHDTRVTVSSHFADSLMNVSIPAKSRNEGAIITPYLEVGYVYPIIPHLEAAADVRYRYQKSAESLTSTDYWSGADLPCLMAGAEAGVSIVLRLGRLHKGGSR